MNASSSLISMRGWKNQRMNLRARHLVRSTEVNISCDFLVSHESAGCFQHQSRLASTMKADTSSSIAAGAHCPDEYGLPIREPLARGTVENDDVASEARKY